MVCLGYYKLYVLAHNCAACMPVACVCDMSCHRVVCDSVGESSLSAFKVGAQQQQLQQQQQQMLWDQVDNFVQICTHSAITQ
jgi:hypothetical protein